MWLTYKELMAFYGFSRRTALNHKNKGEWPVAEVKNPRGGKSIVFMFVEEADQHATFEDNGVERSQIQHATSEDLVIENVKFFVSEGGKKEKMTQPGVSKCENQHAKKVKALKNNVFSNTHQHATNTQLENQHATNTQVENQHATNVPNENQGASGFNEEKNHPDLEIPSHPSTEGNKNHPDFFEATPPKRGINGGQAVHRPTEEATYPVSEEAKLPVERSLPSELDPIRWMPLDRAVGLSGMSRKTLYRRIESKELISITVADKVSKTRTLISIDGFSDMVKRRWELEVLDGNRALGDLLEAEKNEFNVHSMAEREKAWQRKAIIDKYLEYKKQAKLRGEKLGRADHEFEIKLNNGEILPFILKKMEVESISVKTIKKWEKKYRDSGDSAYPVSLLEQKRGVVGRKPLVTNQVKNLIVNVSKARISWDSTEVMTIVKNKLAEKGLKLQISQRTLFNIMKETRKDVLGMSALEGPEGYKNKARPHTIRINNALPGQIWESDGKHSSVPVFSPFYREKPEYSVIFKPVVVWWIDVATKAITGCAVGKTETSSLVRNALRDGFDHFGLPEHIRTDNAKSFRNIAFAPEEFIYKKRDTQGKQRALKMIDSGDLGLYKNVGIKEYHFTIPKNSESKMIEPFWNWCFSKFEDKFPVYFGRKPAEREEMLKMTNRELCVKYSDAIPTLEQFEELLRGFIHLWNTSTELCTINRNIEGKVLSPIEAYNLKDKVVPSQATLDRYMRDPYLKEVKVQRDGIYVGGIYYRHAIFASLIGKKILYYYDERNIWSVKIASTMGEYYDEPARAFVAGYQYDDDMSSLRDTRRYEKHGIGYYLALRATGAKSMKEVQKVLRAPVEELIADQDRLHTKQKDSYTSLDYKPRDKNIELLPENEIIVTEEDIIKAQVNEQEYIETEDRELEEIRKQIEELDNQEEEEDREWEQAFKQAGLN